QQVGLALQALGAAGQTFFEFSEHCVSPRRECQGRSGAPALASARSNVGLKMNVKFHIVKSQDVKFLISPSFAYVLLCCA
ncbi:hypothetical protein K7H20_24110, partial [Salipiger manganoxidans]|uniref:hypothetical protein n=1 Tax=Salipiger marinus TaxID=555512 RepID=UPI001E61E537